MQGWRFGFLLQKYCKNLVLIDSWRFYTESNWYRFAFRFNHLHHLHNIAALPVIEKDLVDMTVCEGQDLQFESRCFAKPNADFMWMKNDKTITNSDRIKSSQMDPLLSILSIRNVNRSDCGNYSLIASNSIGEAKSTASLKVKGNRRKCYIIQRNRRSFHQCWTYSTDMCDHPRPRPRDKVQT